MAVKNARAILAATILFGAVPGGFAQGFINLNFETANLSGYNAGSVPATNAIPGWTAYVNGNQAAQILYNTINLDEPAVSIQGTNSTSITPIQGNFSVFLQGGSAFAFGDNSAIGQTGQIPVTALSLVFWGYASSTNVSFAGQTLSLVTLGSTSNYNIYGADVSAFAGQIGQLLFTASRLNNDIIDNIQFSSTPVPEPSTLALSGLGGLFLAWRRRNARVF
jgi:hypothetical protein